MSPKKKLSIPDDLEECQEMIVSMFEQMQDMQGQLDALLRAKYGKKSESLAPGQLRLFEEKIWEVEEDGNDSGAYLKSTRAVHGRKRLPKDIPRSKRIYDVPEAEQACPQCNSQREVIGNETSEQYDYRPASIQVIEHIRLKRACQKCGEQVVIAGKPVTAIERCIANENMLAYIATCKFADHLPLNRLEGIFKRDGVTISRSTMCGWMAALSVKLRPIHERMRDLVIQSKVIWTDDTPVKMQDRTDERNMRNARVWVYIGDKANPYTVFDFTKSRKRDGPVEFLKGYNGFLQADAFAGYDCMYAGGEVSEVACWAHARRKFFDALQTNSYACKKALEMIQQLYVVEQAMQSSNAEEREAARQARSIPILDEFETWLNHQKLVALPKSPLGKAVTYALNNWKALRRYASNGELSIDNNKSERALRSMAVGRKNWLFLGSAEGGKTAATIASIIATCKSMNIHPRIYIADVLMRLASGTDEIDSLLPGKWIPSM